MTRRTKQVTVLFGAAILATVAWPGASQADTSLGGYSGIAQAAGIRVQVYEPVLPLPSNPQVDGSIGYTKSNTDTGPVSRALSSYLWPGDVLGDGFNQLAGPNARYPVQINSRFPATATAPAHNVAQLTEGNGMTTSSDGFTTTASVTGLGVAGPGTDLLSGIGKGLGQIFGGKKANPGLPDVPLPVSKTLAGIATLQNLHSESSITVANKTVTASAHISMTAIKLLGGLISIDGMDITSKTVSDGTKATTSGTTHSLVLSILGQKFTITDKAVEAAGTSTAIPPIPSALTSLLDKIGISIKYAPTTHSVQGATGSYAASGLVISVDTVPLKKALNLGGIIAPLQKLIEQIPKIGEQIAPVLNLGPKIVLTLGDVSTTANAAPAYTGSGTGGGGSTGTTSGGTGSSSGGTGGTIPAGTGIGPVQNPPPATGATSPVTGSTQPVALDLPGLGSVPRALILGLLIAALAIGWAVQAASGFVLGAGRSCMHGLTSGVPDLRKG